MESMEASSPHPGLFHMQSQLAYLLTFNTVGDPTYDDDINAAQELLDEIEKR